MNCLFKDSTTIIQTKVTNNNITAKYGIELNIEPYVNIITCCINAPPDFPIGLQMISIIAFFP